MLLSLVWFIARYLVDREGRESLIVFSLVCFVLLGWSRKPAECDRNWFGLSCCALLIEKAGRARSYLVCLSCNAWLIEKAGRWCSKFAFALCSSPILVRQIVFNDVCQDASMQYTSCRWWWVDYINFIDESDHDSLDAFFFFFLRPSSLSLIMWKYCCA